MMVSFEKAIGKDSAEPECCAEDPACRICSKTTVSQAKGSETGDASHSVKQGWRFKVDL